MVSPAFNVLRWSALSGGIIYGFFHNRSLASAAATHHAQAEFDKKAKLIEEARAEYRKLHPKPAATSGSVEAVNLDDPKFDPAQFIEQSLKAL